MKVPFFIVLLAGASCLHAAESVVVPNAGSPEGTFAIRLTHDRNKDTDLPLEDDPQVQIVSTSTKKVLAEFGFVGDPESDAQPLRTKIRVNWNAEETAVALSFSERFYTHLVVYRLEGTPAKPKSFTAVTLPGTAPIIQAMIPRFREFRSRWHNQFLNWSGRSTIQFSAGTGALVTPLAGGDPNIMAVYSFTVDITEPTMPIIKRIERINDD